jgi:hypothetical protein
VPSPAMFERKSQDPLIRRVAWKPVRLRLSDNDLSLGLIGEIVEDQVDSIGWVANLFVDGNVKRVAPHGNKRSGCGSL